MTDKIDLLHGYGGGTIIELPYPPGQPIETAPKDGTDLLLWQCFNNKTGWGKWSVGYWHPEFRYWQATAGVEDAWHVSPEYDPSRAELHPTHWMPLPEPPHSDGGP